MHPRPKTLRAKNTMQYITQLVLETRTQNNTPSQNENNFTFNPKLLKSARADGGSGWIRTIDPRLIKTVL